MELIIESIFFSFPIFIIGSSLTSLSNNEKIKNINADLKLSTYRLLTAASLFYFLLLIAPLMLDSANEEATYSGLKALNRATGPYWFLYLFYLLTFSLIPQLLWIKKIRNSKAFIWFLVLSFIFVMNIERFIIIMTSLHRDHVPDSWSYYLNINTFIDWLIKFGIFLFLLLVVFLIRRKTMHNKSYKS